MKEQIFEWKGTKYFLPLSVKDNVEKTHCIIVDTRNQEFNLNTNDEEDALLIARIFNKIF